MTKQEFDALGITKYDLCVVYWHLSKEKIKSIGSVEMRSYSETEIFVRNRPNEGATESMALWNVDKITIKKSNFWS